MQKGLGRLRPVRRTQMRVHSVCVVCSVCVRVCDFIFTATYPYSVPRNTQPSVRGREKEPGTSCCPNRSRAKAKLSPSSSGGRASWPSDRCGICGRGPIASGTATSVYGAPSGPRTTAGARPCPRNAWAPLSQGPSYPLLTLLKPKRPERSPHPA